MLAGRSYFIALAVLAAACASAPAALRPEAPLPAVAPATAAPQLLVDAPVLSLPPLPPPLGAARRELVLQDGHLLWIHDAALHPEGDVVALLSLDMPDLGQELTPPIPFATVSLVDAATGLSRASWRVPAPDLEGTARVRFSPEGSLLFVDGDYARMWDLRDGRARSEHTPERDDRPRRWRVPDARGEHVLVQSETGVSLEPWHGGALWTATLDGPMSWARPATHPAGDRFAIPTESSLWLFDRSGRALGHAPSAAMSLAFHPLGGALYACSEDSCEIHDPRDARSLGPAPWREVRAFSYDGARLAGDASDGSGHRIFDARTGAASAPLELAESSDDVEVSRWAFAFTPGSHRLWACAYVASAVSAAPPDVPVPPSAAPDSYVDYIECRRFDPDGALAQRFHVASPAPIPTGAGPLSLTEVGPELAVGASEHLVVAAMSRVLAIASDGRLVRASEDRGLEAMISSAAELPDGSGIALGSPVALAGASAAGASAMPCPGLLSGGHLRVTGGAPRLYSQRFECDLGVGRAVGHEAILGVSGDGRTLVLAEGDLFMAEGEIVLRTPEGRRRSLRRRDAWCQIDGCGPEATFVPGDRHLVIDEDLYDARTGRRVRALDHEVVAFAPSGAHVALVEREGGEPRALRIEELRTGRLVRRRELPAVAGEAGEDRWPDVRFVDERRVAIAFGRSVALVAIDGGLVWEREVSSPVYGLALSGEHLQLLTDAGPQRLALADGAPVTGAVPSPAATARCTDGRLEVVDRGATAGRAAGPCSGAILHVGERFAISADGSRARVTRLADGAGLWLRVVIDPGQGAYTLAEDDEGNWLAPPEVFDRLRLRDAGPITDAPLLEVSERAPGYDPRLLSRFFEG